jgi:hypothetical protein
MPHRTNFDMSVLQFRPEGLNISNHTQWSTINNYQGTQNFLYSTREHMPWVLQFAFRITF